MVGVTVVLVAIVLLCGVPVLATAYEARSPDYQCAISQALPAGAELMRGAIGSLTLWPFGLECRYFDSTGQLLIVPPRWFVTGLATASFTAFVAAVALPSVVSMRARRSRRRLSASHSRASSKSGRLTFGLRNGRGGSCLERRSGPGRRGLFIHIDDSIIAYVNIQAPALSPLFRSDAQGEILARLFLNADRSFTIAELARAAKSPYASAHREVSRIVQMGLASTEKRGQSVEVRVRADTPAFRPLAELLALTYGPAVVIPQHLSGISGIDQAFIYGSWAARRAGEPGDAPADIDVLLVGNPPRGAVNEAARLAGTSLGREVNVRIVSAAAWEASGTDPFLRTLTERPIVSLELLDDNP